MQLTDFDPKTFLSDYWQQRPLLIRRPWAAWANPLEPDELAGLACENGVEARLVTRKRATWAVEHGPFGAKRFAKLGKKPWTLLVQAVDAQVPAVAALIAPFRFIPNWRIDDVMVSLASDGGGVGPHYDQYDVFLIQGLGRRRWRVGGRCDAATPLMPHDDLRLLEGFDAIDEWVLEPGDMLYVPPRFAHEGVAVGDDCMTYSVGFRAPSRSELVAHWCDHVLDTLDDDDRYADPGLQVQGNPGEIAADAITALQAMVTEKLGDRAAFARWFGGYSSTRKYPEVDYQPDVPADAEDVRRAIAGGVPLTRNPASRFSFIKAASVVLFVDGEAFDCDGDTGPLAKAICASGGVKIEAALAGSEAAVALIVALLNQGSVAFDTPD